MVIVRTELTGSVKSLETVLFTVTAKLIGLALVGVPISSPLELREKPAGKPDALHV